jgi:hypothetical protein
MPTVEERYAAATAYVRRAVDHVEKTPFTYLVDPVTGAIEWYASKLKTQPARNELAHIESRWLRVTNEVDRARVARDAEYLADHVQETLPGAPQDRKRTNLYAGEVPTGTLATSYYEEVDRQSADVWHAVKGIASGAAHDVSTLGKALLIGGGVLLGLKAISYMRERQQRSRAASGMRRSLSRNLEAEARNASPSGFSPMSMCPVCHRCKNLDENGRVEPHEYPSGGMCPGEGRLPLGPHGRPRTRRQRR